MNKAYRPNILLVDDYETNLELLEYNLESIDANIITAKSGEEALFKIENCEVALAIIDILMPEMDGFELASVLRDDKKRATFPIIFLTAFAYDDFNIYKAYETGAVDYLFKPIKQHVLISKVKIFLELNSQKQKILENNLNLENSLELLEKYKTELEEKNRILKISENRFKTVSELSSDYSYEFKIIDNKPKLVWITEAFKKITGYSPEQVEDEIGWINLIYSDDREITRQRTLKLLSGENNIGEFRIITKDGKIKWMKEYSQSIFDSNGKVTGLLGTARDVTERKISEEIIRESEFRMKFHIENSPMATIEWDADFNVKRWAGEAEKIFGWSAAETIGKPIVDLHLIYEDDIPITEETIKKLTDGVSLHVITTNRNYTKKRDIIYCEWYNSVLRNSEGETVSVMSQVLDVTERLHARELLEKERRDYDTIIDNAPVMIAYKSKDDRFLKVNKAFADFVGYSKEEIIGKTTFDIVLQQEVAKQGRNHDLEVIRTGKPVLNHTVKWSGFKSKKEIWAVYSKIPFYDDNGIINGTVNFILDINNRIMAEKALLESEEHLRLILDNSMDAILLTDPDGTIYSANKSACQMFDMNEEEILKAGRTGIVNLKDHRLNLLLEERIRNGRVTGELTMIKKDDTIFPVELSSSIFLDNSGQTRSSMIIRDISKRVKTEMEIKKAHDQAKAYAKRLQLIREEERTSIAREIHDEFGQVLSALKMNLTLLGNENRINNKYFDEKLFSEEINNMKNIIDSTIRNVRIFTNKLRPDVLDTFGIIEALETHIADFEKLYHIKCTFNTSETELVIDDEKSIAIYRIVQEALTNVARHSKATTLNVDLTIENNNLNLKIEDNGIGITEEKMKEEKKFGIVGMKERAEICDGLLTISGQPEKGTLIELTLPLNE